MDDTDTDIIWFMWLGTAVAYDITGRWFYGATAFVLATIITLRLLVSFAVWVLELYADWMIERSIRKLEEKRCNG